MKLIISKLIKFILNIPYNAHSETAFFNVCQFDIGVQLKIDNNISYKIKYAIQNNDLYESRFKILNINLILTLCKKNFFMNNSIYLC